MSYLKLLATLSMQTGDYSATVLVCNEEGLQ